MWVGGPSEDVADPCSQLVVAFEWSSRGRKETCGGVSPIYAQADRPGRRRLTRMSMGLFQAVM